MFWLDWFAIHPLSLTTGLLAFVSLVLLFISAFISASETAFFSLALHDRKIVEAGHSRVDRLVVSLLQDPSQLLVTFILITSLVNLSFVVISSLLIDSVVSFTSLGSEYLFKILVISFFLLVFGELVPKIYASEISLKMVRRSGRWVHGVSWLMSPLTKRLVSIGNVLTRHKHRHNQNISMDELSHALELTSEDNREDKEMLEGIIKFGDKLVADAMTPRIDIDFIDIKLNFREALARVIETGYSRIPVYSGMQDSVKGVLYGKDLLPYLNKPDNFRWQSLIRPAYFVPETKKIDDLLEDFKTSKIHMAIVVDEYGGVSGLITMEDVLEEIVGEISDEYDEDERQYIRLEDGSIIFEAKILLNDFFKVTGIDDELFASVIAEAETLAGMILEIKGEFPARREVISYGNYSFQILEMDKRRIRKVKFREEKADKGSTD
ncbi:MAG: gliding motility-associated protein GldE [Bacteroidota bacterium]|nr:gliding motility-associated protein GldE [Bacteroidota bacterium]